MFVGIQVIALIFAVSIMYLIFINYKKGLLTIKENIFWQAIWIGFIFLTLFPRDFDFIIGTFKFTRILDLAMMMAFMILTILGISNYLRNKKTEKQIEQIVKKLALNDENKKKSS